MTAVPGTHSAVGEGDMEKMMATMDLGEPKGNVTEAVTVSKEQLPDYPSLTNSGQQSTPVVVKTPFVDPVESAKPKPQTQLMPDLEEKYEALLETVKGWEEIPSMAKSGPIQDHEVMWLTRECLLRYLRATKWNTAEAAKRLLATLIWRRDYGVEELSDGVLVSPENETGKQIILGYDVSARPCLYLSPGRQNTQPSPRQVQHLVFAVERLIDLMIPGQEMLALLINFKQSKTRSNTAPGIGQGKEVLSILQTHYPERLGRACIINVPWIVWGFFKLITPFIDPLTREKLKFNEDVAIYVPREQLWKEDYNGEANFEYDHDVYWPALIKLCDERRAERKLRWEKAGKRYGESEELIQGGVGDSPAAQEKAAKADSDPNSPAAEIEEPRNAVGTQATGHSDVPAETSETKLITGGD